MSTLDNSSRRGFSVVCLWGVAAVPLALACRQSRRFSCDDTRGLSENDKRTRETLGYVDRAPDLTKTCEKCVQYIKPIDAACAGCKLMKGPVHPDGHCNVFAPISG